MTRITLAVGIFLAGVAEGQTPMAPNLAPARPKQSVSPATTKRATAVARSNDVLTQDDLKQLDQMLQSLKPKERKQFAKALKQLSPEGRKQLVEGMKRQQRRQEPASHAAPPHVVKKAPPPLPRRLAF